MKKGIFTDVNEITVIDADTVRVKKIIEFDIRLTDEDGGYYDAPEIHRPKSEEEKVLGIEATNFLIDLLKNTKIEDITIYIPHMVEGKLGTNLTFARTTGCVYIKEDNVVKELKKRGYEKCLVSEQQKEKKKNSSQHSHCTDGQ